MFLNPHRPMLQSWTGISPFPKEPVDLCFVGILWFTLRETLNFSRTSKSWLLHEISTILWYQKRTPAVWTAPYFLGECCYFVFPLGPKWITKSLMLWKHFSFKSLFEESSDHLSNLMHTLNNEQVSGLTSYILWQIIETISGLSKALELQSYCGTTAVKD